MPCQPEKCRALFLELYLCSTLEIFLVISLALPSIVLLPLDSPYSFMPVLMMSPAKGWQSQWPRQYPEPRPAISLPWYSYCRSLASGVHDPSLGSLPPLLSTGKQRNRSRLRRIWRRCLHRSKGWDP